MGNYLEQLPEIIQNHVKTISEQFGLPNNEDSYEKIAQNWLEKKKVFEEQISRESMKEVDSFMKDDSAGAVALTYSGSLLLIGPLNKGYRKAGYYSIGMRKDVPESLVKEESVLASDIKLNSNILFEQGPVKNTSAIYKIAVCEEQINLLEEEEKINEVTMIMTEKFVDLNRELLPAKI